MVDLRCGDCLEIMKDIPDKSIDCIVTSPPYWKGFEIELDEKYFEIAKERIESGE